jgi:hypothetical protein
MVNWVDSGAKPKTLHRETERRDGGIFGILLLGSMLGPMLC